MNQGSDDGVFSGPLLLSAGIHLWVMDCNPPEHRNHNSDFRDTREYTKCFYICGVSRIDRRKQC